MSTNSTKPRLLIVSYRFPPETYPLAIGIKGVIDHLRRGWEIDVVTAAADAYEPSGVHIKHVRPRSLSTLQRRLGKLRMDKIARLLLFPDPFWPWIRPALRCVLKAHAARPYDAVLTFVMPFSGGFVGAALKNGLPLVINLDDSPTCTDMNPRFPSRLHYRFARWMEYYFVRTADRVVYVSRDNRDRVRARQPSAYRDRLHLIRCGAQPFSDSRPDPDLDTYPSSFRIVYTGAMSGWYAHDPRPQTWLQSLYRAWNRIGTFDDGPCPESTPRLLDLLDHHRAQATFFVVGKSAVQHPHLIRGIHHRGHALGNHTWSHPILRRLSRADRLNEIDGWTDHFTNYDTRLFRAPWGDLSLSACMDLLLRGYRSIGWDVQVQDWLAFSALELANRLASRVRAGSIVLLHDALFRTRGESDLNPDRTAMLNGLDAYLSGNHDLSFVSVPELMAAGRPVYHRTGW